MQIYLCLFFKRDSLRHNKVFYGCLLLCTVYFLLIFYVLYFLMHRKFKEAKKFNKERNLIYPQDQSELILWLFIVPNFICYTFSRGVHIQFLLWIHYSLIYLFTSAARLPVLIGFPLYLLFDWCHSWVPNVIQLTYLNDLLKVLYLGDWQLSLKVFNKYIILY